MADAISIQELIDARTDAKTLEEAVNGDAVTTVLSRLGETYPTLANALSQIDGKLDSADAQIKQAITDLFQNGGLPAEPFETKAQMTSEGASLPDGKYAMVTDDTVNNGLYIKTAGAWVKSGYDPLADAKVDATTKANNAKQQAVEYTDSEVFALKSTISNKISNDNGLDLSQKLDVNGNVYAKYDKDAGLHLAGLDGTVQDNLAKLIPTASNTKSIKRRFLTQDAQSYINHMNMLGVTYLKPPVGLMPSNYRVPDDIIYQFKMDAPTQRLSVDTTYRPDDMVVHPNIIECLTPIRGYKYILALNGLTREPEENPFVYGSNDLVSFDLLDGFVQPMDLPESGGYLSDICWTYDPTTGELVCFWRSTVPVGSDFLTEYRMRKTKDLETWTDIEVLFPPTLQSVDGITSPAILYDTKNGIWKMWAVLRRNGHVITYRTNRNLDSNWSSPKYVTSGSTRPWHIEVKYVGDKFVMIVNRLLDSNGYFLGISSDGENWKFSGTDLFTTTQTGLYKASFLPLFNSENELYLEILYTVNELRAGVLHRYMYNATTNAIAIEGV